MNAAEWHTLKQFAKKATMPDGVIWQPLGTSLQCLLQPVLDEGCEGCDSVKGATAMTKTSLVNTIRRASTIGQHTHTCRQLLTGYTISSV